MNRWALGALLWLAFNASLLLFAWLAYWRSDRRAAADVASFAEWEREMAMWLHPSNTPRSCVSDASRTAEGRNNDGTEGAA